jgi:hypothetical protein
MNPLIQSERDKLTTARSRTLADLTELHAIVETHRPESISNLVDLGYLLRERARLAEQERKEIEACLREVSKTICIKLVTRGLNNPDDLDMTARGELATATSRVKQEPIVPKAGTEEYDALTRSLGIVDPLRLSRIHWPSFVEYVTSTLEQGGNLPEGIQESEVFTSYDVTYRKRSNADHAEE